jgi:hypothetical protein
VAAKVIGAFVLHQIVGAQLDCVARSQVARLHGRDQPVMLRVLERSADVPAVVLIGHPVLDGELAEIDGIGVSAQALAMLVGVFVEIRHRELTR